MTREQNKARTYPTRAIRAGAEIESDRDVLLTERQIVGAHHGRHQSDGIGSQLERRNNGASSL